jgi:hypothetical protein
MVAMYLQEYWRAIELFEELHKRHPDLVDIKKNLVQCRKLQRERAVRRPDGRQRFLLIKPWGCGFCSDLDHVLGGLFLSELTGRIPIVHWGDGSLFLDPPDQNAWSAFFAAVSEFTISDLGGKGYTFFPPKWNDGNIGAADVNKFEGECSRMGPQFFLNRTEDVAVSDFHIRVMELIPWTSPVSPYARKPVEAVYQSLVKKFLRLNPAIQAEVDQFASQHFAGRPMIAAHARGSDKACEEETLDAHNKNMPDTVASMLEQVPRAGLFLLTDDNGLRATYEQRFGDRLTTTNCARTSTLRGLHYCQHESRKRLGVEVLKDMYLAARCEKFVGLGFSNVSAMIMHLKAWPEGSVHLMHPSMHYKRNGFLHLWEPPPGFEEKMAQHQAKVEQSEGRA